MRQNIFFKQKIWEKVFLRKEYFCEFFVQGRGAFSSGGGGVKKFGGAQNFLYKINLTNIKKISASGGLTGRDFTLCNFNYFFLLNISRR